jgi:integrase
MAVNYDKQKNKWVADYSVIIDGNRARRRKFFNTKSEATACFNTQKESFRRYGQTTEFDLQEYARYKRLEESLQGATLEDAVRFYNASEQAQESIKLEQAIKEYLEQKKCSKEHMTNLKIYLNKFLHGFGDVYMNQIKARNIHKVLDEMDYSLVYKNNLRRAFVTFFNYCIFAKYAVTNEAQNCPMFDEDDEGKEIEIIDVAEAKKLFAVLEQSYPHLVPINALRAFAGLRTAHAESFKWSQINFEEKGIRFTGGGKRVQAFLEDYPSNLWAWLEKYKDLPIKEKHSRETGQVMKEHNIHCPHNGLRHGFATYHLGKFKNINTTSILMMHRGSTRMLFDRYRGVSSFGASVEYFEILPQQA